MGNLVRLSCCIISSPRGGGARGVTARYHRHYYRRDGLVRAQVLVNVRICLRTHVRTCGIHCVITPTFYRRVWSQMVVRSTYTPSHLCMYIRVRTCVCVLLRTCTITGECVLVGYKGLCTHVPACVCESTSFGLSY